MSVICRISLPIIRSFSKLIYKEINRSSSSKKIFSTIYQSIILRGISQMNKCQIFHTHRKHGNLQSINNNNRFLLIVLTTGGTTNSFFNKFR